MLNQTELSFQEAVPAGRRESAKRERRSRIVDAAHDLLCEVGLEALSMKQLAANSGLSLSTVYNLFGSKQAVLGAVFDRDLLRYEQLVAQVRSSDALARIFDAVDVAAALYAEDPRFYRAILWRSAGDPFLNVALREPRTRFWRRMIASAVEAGHLKPSVDSDALSALIVQIFSGAMLDWTAGAISLEQFRKEVRFGFAVSFAAFAVQPMATRLRAMIRDHQKRLAAPRGAGRQG